MLILDIVGAEVFQKFPFLGAERELPQVIPKQFVACFRRSSRVEWRGGVPSREEKDEACSNKALRWNRLHMLLSEAIRSAVFCYLIYLFEKRKMFEHSRSGRGLTHRKPTHKHMGRVQVGGQMALNSLSLGRGHQRSLCVLLSIYFTHHPSSGRDDPATLELGLPVS